MRSDSENSRRLWVRGLCGALPFICLAIYLIFPEDPKRLVLIAGVSQAVMLPLISFAAIYFRYRHGDARIAPGRFWDIMLWISALGMLVAGGWVGWTKLSALYLQLQGS